MAVLSGIHPVMEALRAGRPLERLLVAQGAGGPRVQAVIDLARQAEIPVRFEPRTALDRLAGTAAHQGIVALGAAKKYAELDSVAAPRASLFRAQWFLLLLVMLVIAGFTGSINPRFFRTNNIVNIFEQISTLGVVASGATILMISGNFDISVGANIGLSSCVMAMLIKAGAPGQFS